MYPGWDAYQELLVMAIAPLTPEQLTLRSAPHLRAIGQNCQHIIGGRVRWCNWVMGMGDEAFAAMAEWDRSGMPERSADELVSGLRSSWQVLHDALQSMDPADLDRIYPNVDREPDEPEEFSGRWIIWHLIEHDVFHGGEISQILGMHGLPGLDL
jgi:uncharacterized damage-inducible protein DinB